MYLYSPFATTVFGSQSSSPSPASPMSQADGIHCEDNQDMYHAEKANALLAHDGIRQRQSDQDCHRHHHHSDDANDYEASKIGPQHGDEGPVGGGTHPGLGLSLHLGLSEHSVAAGRMVDEAAAGLVTQLGTGWGQVGAEMTGRDLTLQPASIGGEQQQNQQHQMELDADVGYPMDLRL
jgi:hypothetical protein